MIAPLEQLQDWSAFQVSTLMVPANRCDWRLEEALRYLKGPDFVFTDNQPAQVEFNGSLHFRFPAPRPCDFKENNVVHGRLCRCAERWQERPVIVLLPGYNDSASYNLRFPLIARRCNRADLMWLRLYRLTTFNAVPASARLLTPKIAFCWVERSAQAIAEIRSLTGWLLGERCPTVALWGYSRGASDAGKAVCRDARLAAVVRASPPVRCKPLVQQLAVRPRIRARFQSAREVCERMNLTAMNLIMTQPAIPREKILLIEGIHDVLCSKDDIEDLWESWGQPDIWRLPHGHVSVCCGFVPGLTARVLRWLEPRLNDVTIRTQNK